MAKVLVSDTLSEDGLAVLKRAPGIEVEYKPGLSEDALAEAIGGFDALVIRSGSKVTAKVLAQARGLKVIGRAGIGVDNVDVKEASRRGIIVMNTPTGNAVTTAEHALALLMSIARRIPFAAGAMKQGKWEKKGLSGRELAGKTLGVVGLGNIGRIVADRAQGLHMKVIGFDPVMSKERAAELGVELVSIDDLFRRADAITVHTPLTPETKGLVNDAAVEKMKKGVLLVNAARGGIFEDAALLKGLASGKIGGVAVDVFVEEPPGLTELIQHPLVVATPHLGASTEEAQERVAVEIAEQIVSYLANGEIQNSVNVPAVPGEMAGVLGPYLNLGRCLGEFLGQVEKLAPRQIELTFSGEIAALPVAPVVSAALAGVLDKFLEEGVNPVNAPMVAQDRGIEVRRELTNERSRYSTLVSMRVTGSQGEKALVCGTLAADGSARLVQWNDYKMDAQVGGTILVIRNEDRPGVIGAVGSILGKANINVSRMQVGLADDGRDAASLWALDKALAPELVDQIRASSAVKQAYCVTIG
ncbi:MAG TPA: phosphoglycerate dehydrogenase [Polyangiaceae bacterium]|jgi:D-3-phosphoglycerate dehydrogenase|nr:phosphoglycerate dehydrogenase [Polyangiaceae bacterium]